MVDEWEREFGAQRPERVDALVGEVVDGQMSAKMSANQRAAAAWYRANGDRERTHTTGVFLKRARVAGAAPVLGVYVDSHVMATDFGVNKDIYLARLANIGFMVSGIEFIPSREGYRVKRERAHAQRPVKETLPELSQEERDEVESLTAQLPEHLRESASKAIALSFRRQKLEKTQNANKR